MKLRYSPASPFAKKIAIAAHVLGFADRIEMVDADGDKDDAIRSRNPLGKIPLLITDEGDALFDSRVILEYLDHLAGGDRIIPAAPKPRFEALKLQALADGIMDAAILIMYETRYREPGNSSPMWLGHQQKKVDQALAVLDGAVPGTEIHVGTIAVASALAYLDLRYEGAWRLTHRNLEAWLKGFAERVPAYSATAK